MFKFLIKPIYYHISNCIILFIYTLYKSGNIQSIYLQSTLSISMLFIYIALKVYNIMIV